MPNNPVPFAAVPRSNVDAKTQLATASETDAIALSLTDVLNWFFSNKGKHRDYVKQFDSGFDGFAVDPQGTQRALTIQQIGTYQSRNHPSIIIRVGSPQTIKAGMGVSLEHHPTATDRNCLLRRSIAKYHITLYAETDSESQTKRLGRLLGRIFTEFLSEYYQNVILNDVAGTQLILPQEVVQDSDVTRNLQQDANVERTYLYSINFEATFESLTYVQGYHRLSIQPGLATPFCKHDLPGKLQIGKYYLVHMTTNHLGVKLYCDRPDIFNLQPTGVVPGEGDITYRGQVLKSGRFILQAFDNHGKSVYKTEHVASRATTESTSLTGPQFVGPEEVFTVTASRIVFDWAVVNGSVITAGMKSAQIRAGLDGIVEVTCWDDNGPLSFNTRISPLPQSVVTLDAEADQAGEPNHVATVTTQSLASYSWQVENGYITGGESSNQLTFGLGEANKVCRVSCTVTSPATGLQAVGSAVMDVLPFTRTCTFETVNLIKDGALAGGTLKVGKEIEIIQMKSNLPAWIRFYRTQAQATADLTRSLGDTPTGDHGIIAEAKCSLANGLTINFDPQAKGSNGDVPQQNLIYWTVALLDGVGPVKVDLTYVQKV